MMPALDDGLRIGRLPSNSRRFYFILDSDNITKMIRAAEKRKVHPNKFASQLMRVIMRDDLIDAIMDDEDKRKS